MVKKDVKFEEDITPLINKAKTIILKKNPNQKLTDGQTIIIAIEHYLKSNGGI
jgi:hypothetical protein